MSNKSGSAVGESAVSSSPTRRFDQDFKRDAVRLVTDEKYSFQAAASVVGVSQKACGTGMPSSPWGFCLHQESKQGTLYISMRHRIQRRYVLLIALSSLPIHFLLLPMAFFCQPFICECDFV